MITLPSARGPLSRSLTDFLEGASPRLGLDVLPPRACADDDLQLALYLCYELHHGGIEGVPDEMEWSPAVVRLRRTLETRFETSLRAEIARSFELPVAADRPMPVMLRSIIDQDRGASVAEALSREPTLDRYREFLSHRAAYHLKEADPYTWGIPRLQGAPKAALVQIQADEYGGGDAAWMHSALFAGTMRAVGLDPDAGAPLDRLPGVSLAVSNVISMFGLQRRLRGALVGHLAIFEMTSCIPNRRYGDGMRRLGYDEAATRFFDEHVEADAVHEAIAANELAGGLVEAEPELFADLMFGAAAAVLTERRWSDAVLAAWSQGRSSLVAIEASPAAARAG